MKFIHNKYLVDLILVFEANQVLARCSHANAAPKEVPEGRIVDYADLRNETITVSDFIIGNGEKYSEDEVIKSFSLNSAIQKICVKIDESLLAKSNVISSL